MEKTLAAQYLRVSTERQEYSLDCQRAGIEAYARQHNLTVCHTYVDEARSGLEARNRQGLLQLLQDVLGGHCPYRLILVYDVSRWGRFQDPDEAAHYEFLCKAAGVRVHYCAEHFGNDAFLPNIVLKALKRVMAGEYSRELSDKVFAAMIRVTKDGYRTGGRAGYGLRRMLISANKIPKGEIPRGERKSLANERVKLIPGPPDEIHWVREIYRMFTSESRGIQEIANELNRLNVPGLEERKWTRNMVRGILTNPKYEGTCLYNVTSKRLHSPEKTNAETEWVVVPGAFAPIVDPATFEIAQREFRNRCYNWSNEQVVEALRSVLQINGTLSAKLLHGQPNTMSKEGYRRRFGSLLHAYELAGYESPLKSTILHRNQIRKVRKDVMETLVELFPGEVSIQTRGPVRRNCLRLRNGIRVAVRACRRKKTKYKGPSWVLQGAREKRLITLLVCVNPENTAPELIYVLPPIANRSQVSFSDDHSWFKSGMRLKDLTLFCKAVCEVLGRGKQAIGGGRKQKGWLSEDARAAMVTALRMRRAAKNAPSG